MMRALITGVAGFIGSTLADRLLSDNWEVHGIDDLSTGSMENITEALANGLVFIRGDILDITDNNYDVVFHQAAVKIDGCINNPEKAIKTNLLGTLAVSRLGCKVIYASSAFAKGDTLYGALKLASEKLLPTNATILRYSNVYGPRLKDGVHAIWGRQMKAGSPITIIGDGSQLRTFTHVDYIVDANLKALSVQGTFNVANAEPISINDLAKQMGATKVEYKPSRFSCDCVDAITVGEI